MSINQAWDGAIAYYDDWMQKALPNYADLFGSALELIPFDPAQPIRVLDLGAGTGLFSSHVLGKYPRASFVLYDLGEQMLAMAKTRFAGHAGQFEYILGDYRQMQTEGPFDLVISSLSIHHLSDPDKAALFRSIYSVLGSPGLFINIDQVRGETPYLRDLYWNHWLSQVRRLEPDQARIQASVERRQRDDQDATLADQLGWLQAAGFTNVDCVYKNYFVGVFQGMKA